MDYFIWWRVYSVRTLRTALPEGARSAKQLRKSCANCRAKYEKKAKYRTISGERPWKAETPRSADHKQITEKESTDRLSILNEYHNQGFPIMYCDVIPVPIRRLPNMLLYPNIRTKTTSPNEPWRACLLKTFQNVNQNVKRELPHYCLHFSDVISQTKD